MKKRILAILTASFLLSLSFAACGNSETPPASPPPAPSATPETTPGAEPVSSPEPTPTPEPTPEPVPYGEILAERFAGNETVKPEDNLVEYAVTGVFYSGDEIRLTLEVSPALRQSIKLAFTRIIDSEDYNNTMDALECSMIGGSFGMNDINPDAIGLPKSFAKEGLIIFFEGITAELSEEYITVPMFYIIELGDTPKIIDGPLYAGNVFGAATDAGDTQNPADNIYDEYAGQWAGSVDDIFLSFNVESDGTGIYSFEQSGYYESYEFSLEAGTETFSVKIPANNTLGISKIEGTYSYLNGILTLNVQTSFFDGRVFDYTVPCQRS